MIYQSSLGAWPLGGVDASFVERMQAYAVKAAREGKQHTSWLVPDERYETGLENFLGALLDRDRSASFIASFDAFARRTALMGALNSMTQLTLKSAIPGVPDFYQGTEFWDLSLVDPDNRRPVDFAARSAALASIGDAPNWPALADTWLDSRVKLALTQRLLALRARFGDLFARGSYRPLEVVGPHRNEIIAFARISGRNAVIVVTGRLFKRATHGGRQWPCGESWNASVCVDDFCEIAGVIVANKQMSGPRLAVSELFGVLPIAVLQAKYAPVRPDRSAARGKTGATAV
jgi:(1->4)-alpha-D-glucan 1-alpha-D-glucosylmutase